jgi:hypothetical protein
VQLRDTGTRECFLKAISAEMNLVYFGGDLWVSHNPPTHNPRIRAGEDRSDWVGMAVIRVAGAGLSACFSDLET